MAASSTPRLIPQRTGKRLRRWSLASQYNLASLAVLLSSLLVIGWWVGQQITVGVTHRAAAAAALYVENFIVVQLQGLDKGDSLSLRATAQIEHQWFRGLAFGE